MRLFIILIFILMAQFFYYFNKSPFLQFFNSKQQGTNIIDALQLHGFDKKNSGENLKIENNILILDNTYGHAKNGIYSFINRKDLISIGEKFEIELQIRKKKGKAASVNVITIPGDNATDWWTIQKAVEIIIRDNNDLEIRSYNNNEDYDEEFYIGRMPKDEYIRLQINKNVVTFKNKESDQIGEAIFDKNPFENHKVILLGVATHKESILEIFRFLLSIPVGNK